MLVTIPNEESTKVLDEVSGAETCHAVWFQNFETGSGVYLNCQGDAEENEFFLGPASEVGEGLVVPASLVVQNTGGDTTLVNAEWRAWQNSGGAVNIKCGRW